MIPEYLNNYPEKVRVNPQDEIASAVQNFSSKEAMEIWVNNQLRNFPGLKSFFFFSENQNHLVEVEGQCYRIFSKDNSLSGAPRVTDRKSSSCQKTGDFEKVNREMNIVYMKRVKRNF